MIEFYFFHMKVGLQIQKLGLKNFMSLLVNHIINTTSIILNKLSEKMMLDTVGDPICMKSKKENFYPLNQMLL